ncbi:nitrogen regulation protein NR(II) [Chitinimonas sp. BJYL2]|uniref:two-component system sensor histidine kinase NtrB n=1 Tax=Chitinimonas sp. BJYL2 TaxID=2976696 RepID=UPI0022B5A172|nr:ATP-binding protein [Chitinimonas sp. BJYL2]
MSPPLPLISNDLWRSAKVFNLFRALMAMALLTASWWLHAKLFPDADDRTALHWMAGAYLLLVVVFGACLRQRWPRFPVLLGIQVAADIAFIVGVMHIAGGLKSGIGLMLLPYLAGAGLVSRGRTTLFHAALASIALLLQQLLQYVQSDSTNDLFQAALLCIACFATAWLAFRLARYATESEKLAERRGSELANMAQINRLILQDVSDGVLVLDETDVIRQFNQQAERLLGSGMIAGKTSIASVSPPLARALAAWHAGAAELPEGLDLYPELVRPRFMPVRVGTSATGTVIFLEDIDRLRREAQQLKLAALGRLTANIAHEIRNPLSAIGHAAQLLAEDASDPTTLRLTRIMVENSRRLDKLVRAVLDLNRRDRAEPVDLRLHEWIHHFVQEFREVEGIAASIRVECPQGAVARFDEGQLHQVLWNLCRNGWRYGQHADDSLQLRVVRQGDAWALDVRDDGPGIAHADQIKLFEPFFTTDAKGTGLGLYIAREICAGNEAMLEYVPTPGGAAQQGACFRLTFPARPA